MSSPNPDKALTLFTGELSSGGTSFEDQIRAIQGLSFIERSRLGFNLSQDVILPTTESLRLALTETSGALSELRRTHSSLSPTPSYHGAPSAKFDPVFSCLLKGREVQVSLEDNRMLHNVEGGPPVVTQKKEWDPFVHKHVFKDVGVKAPLVCVEEKGWTLRWDDVQAAESSGDDGYALAVPSLRQLRVARTTYPSLACPDFPSPDFYPFYSRGPQGMDPTTFGERAVSAGPYFEDTVRFSGPRNGATLAWKLYHSPSLDNLFGKYIEPFTGHSCASLAEWRVNSSVPGSEHYRPLTELFGPTSIPDLLTINSFLQELRGLIQLINGDLIPQIKEKNLGMIMNASAQALGGKGGLF
jgi:hypothetical protein